MTKENLPIENCIRFWKAKLFHDSALLSPELRIIIEQTIMYLEEGVTDDRDKDKDC